MRFPTSSLRAVSGLVAAEALALLAAAVFLVVELFVAEADDAPRAAVAAALAAVAAVGLGLVARSLAGGRRWSRAPALVVNLLVLPVAFDLVRAGRSVVGAALLLVAVAVLVLLFVPSTDRELKD